MIPWRRLLLALARLRRAGRGAGVGMVQRLLLVLCLCLGLPAAHASPPLVLEPGRQVLNAWPAITLLGDDTFGLGVQDMLGRLAQFAPPANLNGSLGVHNQEAMWLRLPLEVGDAPNGPWVVSIGYSSLQEVDIYLTREGQVLQQALLGYLRPPGKATLSSRTPAMLLNLQAGQRYDVLVRIRTQGPMILPITVSEMPHGLYLALREQMLQGLLNGLALCLLIYSLIQWASQHERLFAYYALVVLGSTGFSLQFFGIGAQFLWPGNVWMAAHAGIVAGLVALAGSFLFLGYTLLSPSTPRSYQRMMHAGAAATTLVCLAFAFDWLEPRGATAFMSLVGPLPSLLSIPAALRRVREKDPVGTTLLFAWLAYGAAAAVMVGLVQGWLPANFWTMHSFQLGATIDMLLFMRVLGLRSRALHLAAIDAHRERDTLHSLAHTDPLTGLPNRRGLHVALGNSLLRCGPQHLVAVYMLDLDGFKPVNDQYGHDVGDELLVAVTRRLLGHVRESDVVARLGGDEFVVMTSHLSQPEQAHDLGMKLLDAFRSPFALGDLQVHVGLTIGYALAPHDSGDAIGLLRLADAAMYSGKQAGKFCLRRNTGDLALSSS
ncbi:diguanylate cyclase [Paenacidovorax monticola]|uniref:GGDEF domain-containing protein n=1 Tax=Paenacidovorax monticola TaxID=1926868 RepID=A0A7H0HFR0_9BURK|nr:diguanylate cyclase [Paenacidovorax monticola]QNP59376.1 GGDEF domain-containing protein [Paenacidovorax monticola]